VRDYKQLQVWLKAHALVLDVYRVTAKFPRSEQYGLTSQLRRSAASIAANIAEGCGRDTKADFGRFLSIAGGSASEAEYHLLLAKDLGILGSNLHEELDARVAEIKKMLRGLRVAISN